MTAVNEVLVPLLRSDGSVAGELFIALLPSQSANGVPPLLDEAGVVDRDDTVAPIQLLEGAEYRYEWRGTWSEALQAEPAEVLQPDNKDGQRGRLRPGLYTGSLQITLRQAEAALGQLSLEVRSRKLGYLSEYRWMLRDIADQMTELLMNRFAASSAPFAVDETRDAATLYQRFAFLRALLTSEQFQLALAEITRRPYVAWEEIHEPHLPGQAMIASGRLVRQLLGPGARTTWPGGPISTLPVRLERSRTQATYDTTPNRFIKFALEHWRQLLSQIEHTLNAEQSLTPAVTRGRLEVAQVLEQIDAVLHQDLFREIGPLHRFPADNQVLQRREGYRAVFRAYLEFELASKLSWQGGDAVYGAGQRDVATLYEYWAFMQLAQTVAGLVGADFDLAALIEQHPDGLNVVLKSGKETVVAGECERLGRRLRIELCFNRTFSKASGSWTRPMRPDYSVIISAASSEPVPFEPIVVHFDAKYRVQMITELFGPEDEPANLGDDAPAQTISVSRGPALRADLLKMHTYRDAIRRSAGAYVLYPGDDEKGSRYKEYHELLPGLGAFVLRPSPTGDAAGLETLRRFISDVLEHVAERLTAHERGRQWLGDVYRRDRSLGPASIPSGAEGPSPGTTVLLGFVKSADHWRWIQERKTYNVRALGRSGGVAEGASLLYSQLLLLYGPNLKTPCLTRIVSDPERITAEQLGRTGYPDPTCEYFCVQVKWIHLNTWAASIKCIPAARLNEFVSRQGRKYGQPTQITWGDLNPAPDDTTPCCKPY